MGIRLSKRDEIYNDYDIHEIIGKGSFATVKRAISKATGTAVAIKVIKKLKLTAEELSIVHDEVEILHKIHHRYCVQLIEMFETKKKIYMVMDMLSGGELFERIVAKGSYTEAEAAVVIRSVASALSYLHSIGIVHRDLKPENLLYVSAEANSDLKITDFGLAKYRSLRERSEGMITACGTPGYVSPEMLRHERYGQSTDLWSLGVILYVILCGFPPFYSESTHRLYEQIKAGEYDFPSPYWTNISREAKDLVRKLLCVDVSKRYTADQVLQHPWLAKFGQAAASSPVNAQLKVMQLEDARRRFRRAVFVTSAINHMSRGADFTEAPTAHPEDATNGLSPVAEETLSKHEDDKSSSVNGLHVDDGLSMTPMMRGISGDRNINGVPMSDTLIKDISLRRISLLRTSVPSIRNIVIKPT